MSWLASVDPTGGASVIWLFGGEIMAIGIGTILALEGRRIVAVATVANVLIVTTAVVYYAMVSP
jgi:hypothetical protein